MQFTFHHVKGSVLIEATGCWRYASASL